MNRRVALAVALLAAAALIVFLYFGRRKHEASSPSASAPTATKPGKERRGRGEGGGRGGGGDSAPQREMNVLVDDDRAGALRLEGQVIDADEHPVVGAVVTLSTNPPRETKSEKDGSFFFEKLIGREYTLVARADGGVGGPVTARLTSKSDPITLRLRPAASVEVTVRDAETHKPIAGAQVELRDLATLEGTTDGDGKSLFRNVAAGGWEIVAWAPGRAKAFGGARVPAPAAGAAPMVVKHEVELKRGAPVVGHVVGPDGKPVAGALVTFAGVSEWRQSADPRLDAKKTDDTGEFRFEALPAGTFRFAARDEAHAPGSSAPITLDGATERTGIEIKLEAGGVLAGTVVDRAGKPVDSATVRVAVKMRGFAFDQARQTYTDEKGHFEMKALPRREVEALAENEAAASEAQTVDLGPVPEKRDLVITLGQDGKISGIVLDAKGQPIAEASVAAVPDFRRGSAAVSRFDWRLRGQTQELTNSAGRFELHGLADGDYQLAATRPGANNARRGGGFGRQGTSAKVGDTDVKIVLPENGSIKGKVLFTSGTAPDLFTVSTGMFGGTPFATTDGAFLLDELPVGDAQITINGPQFDRVQLPGVKIAADQVTDLGTINVTQGRVIRGRVLADGQPVPDASVVCGRRLIGDGASTASSAGGRGFAPGATGTKTATTDENGVYALYGVGNQDVVLVAEQETLGRSQTVTVPGGADSPTVDITLLPFAALEGTVMSGGKPVDGVVTATSQSVPSAVFTVQSGTDGKFRFDRLAPDTYRVSAMTGRNPMQGIGFHAQVVTLSPGQTAEVAIVIDQGTGSILVSAMLMDGTPAPLAMMYASSNPVSGKTAKDVQKQMGASAPGFQSFGVSFRGNPAKIENLKPGNYTVCAVPFPAEVKGMASVFEYLDREGDALPAYCASQAVADGATAELKIPVTLPVYVPPPGGPITPPPRGGGRGPGGPPPGGPPPGGPPPGAPPPVAPGL